MPRTRVWALSSAVFNAIIVFGAGSIAVAQNEGIGPAPERAAPLPLSALANVVIVAEQAPNSTPAAAAVEPPPVPVTGSLSGAGNVVVEPKPSETANTVSAHAPELAPTGAAPKAALIEPIVAPIKREQPSVASAKAAVKVKTAAASKSSEPAVKDAKSGPKVAAWKQKADAPVKRKVASAKTSKVKTAKN